MPRGQWVKRVRSDPKGAMEADLILGVVGVIIIVMGGLVAVAGVHRRWQSIHDNSPAPLLGNIIAAVGALVILFGLVLAIANVVIWWTGRRRGIEAKAEPTDEGDLLQSIRADGHRDRPA